MKDEGKEKDLSEEYFFFAVNLAKEAGRLAISSRSKQGVAYEMKTSHKDLVTEVDRRVERFVVEEIRHRYPNHGIIGEEGTEIDEKEFSTYRWVIDPIDGTTNFIQQGINFCVSIALYEGNEGQVGVVYDPSRDELFAARRGSGVTLNGERVYPPHLEGMKEALIGTNLIWVGRTRKLQLEEAIYAIAPAKQGGSVDRRSRTGIGLCSRRAIKCIYRASPFPLGLCGGKDPRGRGGRPGKQF